MPRKITVATTSLRQVGAKPAIEANLVAAERLLTQAASMEPDIVCLPELFALTGLKQLVNTVRRITPAFTVHALLVEVQLRMPHPAHVECDEGLARGEGRSHVVGDRDTHAALISKSA